MDLVRWIEDEEDQWWEDSLSVCLFSVFAARLPATCERIHTVSLLSRQVEKNSHFDEGVDPTDSVRAGETTQHVCPPNMCPPNVSQVSHSLLCYNIFSFYILPFTQTSLRNCTGLCKLDIFHTFGLFGDGVSEISGGCSSSV